MGLRMPAPYRHPDSGIYWMRQRVPADLGRIVGRHEEKRSIRRRFCAEKAWHGAAMATRSILRPCVARAIASTVTVNSVSPTINFVPG